jgi:hypothetical protein
MFIQGGDEIDEYFGDAYRHWHVNLKEENISRRRQKLSQDDIN